MQAMFYCFLLLVLPLIWSISVAEAVTEVLNSPKSTILQWTFLYLRRSIIFLCTLFQPSECRVKGSCNDTDTDACGECSASVLKTDCVFTISWCIIIQWLENQSICLSIRVGAGEISVIFAILEESMQVKGIVKALSHNW